MKDNALIKITTVSKAVDESEFDKFELETMGTFSIKNGKFYVIYKESELTGFQNTTTTVKISPDEVLLTRRGDISSRMEFVKDTKRLCQYRTPYGVIPVATTLMTLENNLGEDGGEAEIRYALDFNNENFAVNTLRLSVELKG